LTTTNTIIETQAGGFWQLPTTCGSFVTAKHTLHSTTTRSSSWAAIRLHTGCGWGLHPIFANIQSALLKHRKHATNNSTFREYFILAITEGDPPVSYIEHNKKNTRQWPQCCHNGPLTSECWLSCYIIKMW